MSSVERGQSDLDPLYFTICIFCLHNDHVCNPENLACMYLHVKDLALMLQVCVLDAVKNLRGDQDLNVFLCQTPIVSLLALVVISIDKSRQLVDKKT